jgi:hypothetical protein
MKFEIAFRWEDVESGPGEPYRFPDKPTRHMQKYRVPGVYRWAIFRNDGTLEAVYVGEAEDLKRRLGDYLNPGNRHTAFRVNALLQDYQAQGLKIRLQSLLFDDFVINACGFECGNLSDPFARRAVENLAILDAFQLKCKVLNKGTDVIRKGIESVYKKVPELIANSTSEQTEGLTRKLIDLAKRKTRA